MATESTNFARYIYPHSYDYLIAPLFFCLFQWDIVIRMWWVPGRNRWQSCPRVKASWPTSSLCMPRNSQRHYQRDCVYATLSIQGKSLSELSLKRETKQVNCPILRLNKVFVHCLIWYMYSNINFVLDHHLCLYLLWCQDDVCYRSEANDLALQLARAYTKHEDIITIDG